METNPANMVIHYWHHDPDFHESPGQPRPLPFEGHPSFSSLVARYAGDIPAGAMRTALRLAGTIEEDQDGLLTAKHRHFFSTEFNEDFVRNFAFAMDNLGGTILHNAHLHQLPAFTKEMNLKLGRFERSAWTEYIDEDASELFRQWVYLHGRRFIEDADQWLGQHELPRAQWKSESARAVGVGLYYFEE